MDKIQYWFEPLPKNKVNLSNLQIDLKVSLNLRHYLSKAFKKSSNLVSKVPNPVEK